MWIPEELRQEFTERPVAMADVGARGGWQRHWSEVSEHMSFVGFEPEPEELARLKAIAKANETFVGEALFSKPGRIPLYCTQVPSNTSVFPPNSDLISPLAPDDESMKVVRVEEVDASTLDASLASYGVDSLDFLKLDTQGSELDILRGGERVVSEGLFGVEVEVEFARLYVGQPLFPDVHEFLTGHGFHFIDFATVQTFADLAFNKRGMQGYESRRALLRAWAGKLAAPRGSWRGGKQLIYADAIFFKDPRQHLKASPEVALRRVQVGAFVCCVLGYYEYALQLISRGRDGRLLNPHQDRELRLMVARSAKSYARVSADLRRGAQRVFRRLRNPGR